MTHVVDPIETFGAALSAADGEALVAPGARYTDLEPVVIRIRKRGHRFDLDDRGAAVELADRPHGWLAVAQQVVAAEGMNVNRAGVVFVPAVEHGRLDVVTLAVRLAETSAAVFGVLLELEDD